MATELDPIKFSGFRPLHSTETTFVKTINDLLLASDQGCISLLILLYLRATFDTVDHDTYHDRLQNYTYIQTQALRWFRSVIFNPSPGDWSMPNSDD